MLLVEDSPALLRIQARLGQLDRGEKALFFWDKMVKNVLAFRDDDDCFARSDHNV